MLPILHLKQIPGIHMQLIAYTIERTKKIFQRHPHKEKGYNIEEYHCTVCIVKISHACRYKFNKQQDKFIWNDMKIRETKTVADGIQEKNTKGLSTTFPII